jgi:chromosome segregation ATPase
MSFLTHATGRSGEDSSVVFARLEQALAATGTAETNLIAQIQRDNLEGRSTKDAEQQLARVKATGARLREELSAKKTEAINSHSDQLAGHLAAQEQAESELRTEALRLRKAGRPITHLAPRAKAIKETIASLRAALDMISKSKAEAEKMQTTEMFHRTAALTNTHLKKVMARVDVDELERTVEAYHENMETAEELNNAVADTVASVNGAHDQELAADDEEVLELLGLGNSSSPEYLKASMASAEDELSETEDPPHHNPSPLPLKSTKWIPALGGKPKQPATAQKTGAMGPKPPSKMKSGPMNSGYMPLLAYGS